MLLWVAAMTGCQKHRHTESAVIYDYLEADGFTRADSVVNAISDFRDYEWMLKATDSLNARGELSRSKYLFYRTITLNMLNRQSESLKLYYQLDTLDLSELKTETDIESYVYTYNNYIRMLCDMRRYDRALSEADKADKRLRSIGYTTFTDHHDIAQMMGESQLYMDQTDEAAASFQKAVKGIHTRLGRHRVPLDFRECQKTMNAIAKVYLRKGMYVHAEPWIAIQDSIYALAAMAEDRDTVYLDEMRAEISYSKAMLYHAEGKDADARRAYQQYQQTHTSHQLASIVNDNEYLMQTGQFAQAAQHFERLDEYMQLNAYKCDLENIGRYLLPKYSANLLAGRQDSAIRAASLIAFTYYEALADQKKSEADLLSMVYDTEGKERRIAEQQAQLSRQQLLTVIACGTIILLFLLAYTLMRSRAYKKLDETHRQLLVANERAQESDRMKTAFVQHISHEIRTPLNIITGFAQVVSNPEYEVSEEDRNRMLSDITRNTNEITTLVNELLELSESEVTQGSYPGAGASQSLYARTGVVEPTALCHSVLTESEQENNGRLTLSIESTLPDGFTIESDSEALHKILTRLMSNAMKFTEQGRVTIRLKRAGKDGLTVEVEDTGIGIPPEYQEKVFERFYKVDTFRQGIGLGLTVARRTAELLGGTLTLDGSYTRGARFVLSLPSEPCQDVAQA